MLAGALKASYDFLNELVNSYYFCFYWIYKLVIMDSLEYIEFYSANFLDFSFPWYNNLVQMVQDRWTTEYIHDLQKCSDKQRVFFVEN